ncbi:MAG: hypothetical protein M1503_05160 [Thaumarchaeota archaeon]|nr:hypothetical protein [Nitrososphaerota archaeon]
MKMRLVPAALGGFALAIALILVFTYISPQTYESRMPGAGPIATITSTTTETATTTFTSTTTTTPPPSSASSTTATKTITTSSQTSLTTSSTVSTTTVTTTATSTVSSTTLSTTTAATTQTVTATTTSATTVTSTQPAQTTTLTSAVKVALPTEIAYTTVGVAVIAIIIAAIVVTRRNLASANQLAATTTATAAAGAEAQPTPAVKIGYEVDPEFMGEVKEEGKAVGYWISLPRGTSRDIKVTLKPVGAPTQTIIPRLLSLPKGVIGTFNPPSLELEEPKSETVTLTLEISNDTEPGVHILSITTGPSTEKLYLVVE